MEKIVALTVTYNRSDKLERVVNGLLNQEYEVDKIVIVDNNSSDSHRKKIREIAESNEKIILLNLEENTGGAGGFHLSVKYADENLDYDWIWIMDDDAYPQEDCLKNLINEKNKYSLEKVGFLAPLIYGLDRKEYQIYHHKNIEGKFLKEKNAFSFKEIPDYKKINANAFVGPLISREAVKICGYPDKDLFIYGDDTEYTYRISRKFNGYFIKKAVINHEDPIFKEQKGSWKLYYLKRNRILFSTKYSENKKIIKFYESIKILESLIYNIIHPKRTFKEKIQAARYCSLALKDGLLGQKGKRIKPEIK